MRKLDGKQLGVLLIVLLVLAVILAISIEASSRMPTPSTAAKPPVETTPSAATLQQLQQEPSTFQFSVSYTNKGFMPDSLAVTKGDTVRFTNNSSRQLWIASIGEGSYQIYPGTSTCGGSLFDSCQPLAPGDFWEFTFGATGTWEFQNNLNQSDIGTVIVQ